MGNSWFFRVVETGHVLIVLRRKQSIPSLLLFSWPKSCPPFGRGAVIGFLVHTCILSTLQRHRAAGNFVENAIDVRPPAGAPSRTSSLGLGSTLPSTRRPFNYNRPPAALECAEARMAGWREFKHWIDSSRTAKLIDRPYSGSFFFFEQVQNSNLAMGYQLMATLRPYLASRRLHVAGGLVVREAYGGRLEPVWFWTCMHRSYTPIH
jgi:hypothetical protein